MDLQDAFDAGFEAVKKYMDEGFAAFEDRIKALEARAPLQGEPGPAGKDGPSEQMVADMVARAVAALPPAAPGKDGLNADEAAITERVLAVVLEKFAAIPVPKDGEPGAAGKDGVGLAGALIGRDGHLVVTLTDGTQKELGPVLGKDGEAGKPGKDGADALGFDDLHIEYDGERGLKFVMVRGEQRKEFAFSIPVPIYRGVYKDGMEAKQGDTVTWGGSLWSCKRDTTDKPETSDAWQLAVKRGRDGKDGVMKVAPAHAPVKVG